MDDIIDVEWSHEGVFFKTHHIVNYIMFMVVTLYYFGSLIVTAFTGVYY